MKQTLEEGILTAWSTKEDIETLCNAYAGYMSQAVMEAFKGLALLHQARCEALWKCFEEGLKDNASI